MSQTPQSYTIHTDGGSRGNPGPAATGVVVFDPAGQCVHQFGTFIGITTNNVAEYTAVIHALEWLVTHVAPLPHNLIFKLDSQLVVQQLSGRWKIKDPQLATLHQRVQALISTHQLAVNFIYIPRAQNATADAQVNRALNAQSK